MSRLDPSTLTVDLASYLMAMHIKRLAGGDNHVAASVRMAEAWGFSGDDATEIARRAWLTLVIDACRTRGYSADRVADDLEALARRLRSGEAATKADEYTDELVARGFIALKDEEASE